MALQQDVVTMINGLVLFMTLLRFDVVTVTVLIHVRLFMKVDL